MRKGLIVLSIIGVILVVVSLFLDFKAKSIKDNLIRNYEARLEEDNKNKIDEDNVEGENKIFFFSLKIRSAISLTFLSIITTLIKL